jgi:hypothetical protein
MVISFSSMFSTSSGIAVFPKLGWFKSQKPRYTSQSPA